MKVVCLWHATDGEINRIKDALPAGSEVVAPQGEYFSRFDCSYEDIEEIAEDADAFIGFSFPKRVLRIANKLKILCWLHSGVDDLAQMGVLAAAKQRGFKVTNVRGANAIAIAEQAFMFMMALAKKTIAKHEALREFHIDFPLYDDSNRSAILTGRTVAIIGLGNIGKLVGKYAKAFDMKVLGVRRNKAQSEDHVDSMHGMDELHDVLVQADYVVLAIPNTPETYQFFGKAELAAMKRTAFLVNVARGNLIQEKPLYDALTSGQLRGFGSDVWPKYEYGSSFPAGYVPRLQIQKLPNVVGSNNQAHNADDVLDRDIDAGIQSLAEFATGKTLTSEVDLDLGY